MGSRPATTTTTAGGPIARHVGRRAAVPATPAAAGSPTQRRRRASAAARVQHVRDVVRLRQGRPPRSADLQLRAVDAAKRRLLQRRRQGEELLHAGGVSRARPGSIATGATAPSTTSPPRPGFFDVTSKSLGVDAARLRQDPWPDVFVANDTQPNKLYRNNGNGTFTELGLKAGRGVQRGRPGPRRDGRRRGRSGRVRASYRCGDQLLRRDARPVSRRVGDGQLRDRGARVGPRPGRRRQTLGFGCFFFDVDLDGLQDLLLFNGRRRDVQRRPGAVADRNHLSVP